jgi:hypothetical protein
VLVLRFDSGVSLSAPGEFNFLRSLSYESVNGM